MKPTRCLMVTVSLRNDVCGKVTYYKIVAIDDDHKPSYSFPLCEGCAKGMGDFGISYATIG